MTPATQQKTVQFLKLAAPLIEALLKRVEEQDAQRQKVAALIPGVVNVMVQNKRLPEADREKAASLLQDSAAALEILANVAKLPTDEERIALGNPVEKQASYNENHLGSRADVERGSDNAWFRALGIRS